MSILRTGRQDQAHAWLVSGFLGPSIGPFSLASWEKGTLTYLAGTASDYPSFPFGCLQDTLLAVLCCALDEEGALDLDEPLESYLPELADIRGAQAPLVAHALCHSTGYWLNKPDPGEDGREAWTQFLRLLRPRLTPGSISAHSLIDRLLLLQVVQRVTGRSAYTALRERFFVSSETLVIEPTAGPFAQCHSEVRGSMSDLRTFLDAAAGTSWLDRIATTPLCPIALSSNVRPFAPVADGLGLYRLANGIFGQDGDHARHGYLGLRISPTRDTVVIGHFRSSPIRDHIMNRAVSDLMGVTLPLRNAVLGDLDGCEPGTLAGSYSGIWGSRLYIDADARHVSIAASRGMRAMTAQIQPDGTLTGRWAAPNFWLEPQYLGSDGLPAFRYGKHLYLKD